MSNLKNKLATMNKKAGTIIPVDIINKSESLAKQTYDVLTGVQEIKKSLDNMSEQLADIDYDDYNSVVKEFNDIELNLKRAEEYLNGFANHPGFEK